MGKPNAGKSTLMNLLVGKQLAITIQKHRRHALHSMELFLKDFQIIYIDTPGVITPAYTLQRAMKEAVKVASADADIIIWLVDVKDLELLPWFYEDCAKKPIILVVNKVDVMTANKLNEAIAYWRHHNPGISIIPISAKKYKNIQQLIQKIV